MGRGKTRTFFTRFAETHQLAARVMMGFAKNAFEDAFFWLYPSYGAVRLA